MWTNNKWQKWHDELPDNTKIWLKNQPLWHDRDLAKVFVVGFVAGLIIGAIL